MKIILLEKIAKLGDIGEIIKVKDGYAKNFLIPYHKAILATNQNILLQKKNLHLKTKKENTSIIKNLHNTTILITTESKKNNDLYNKINQNKLIKMLKKLNINIKTKDFVTDFLIKKTGQHKIEIAYDKNTIQNLYLYIIKTNK